MKMKKAIFILFVHMGGLLPAQELSIPKQMEEVFNYLESTSGFHGTVLVSKQGKVVCKKAFGKIRAGEETASTLRTAYDVGSAIKPFTALGVLILADEGKLKLDTRLSAIFPDFPHKDIRLKHLLTHTSGLPDYVHDPGFMAYMKKLQTETPGYKSSNLDLIRWYSLPGTQRLSMAGEKFRYCNGGYVILASVIEEVSGQLFYDFLRENIVEPAAMHDTRFYDQVKDYDPGLMAAGMEYSLDGKSLKEVVSRHVYSGAYGDGGLYSTVGDLHKFKEYLFSGALLSASLLKESFTPFLTEDGNVCPYGYGWIIRSKGYHDRPKTIKHGGSWEGFITAYAMEPTPDHTIIILTNFSFFPPSMGELEDAISQILSGKKPKLPRLPVRDTVARTLFSYDIGTAVKTYYKLKTECPERFFFDEHQLNLLGYLLSWEGRKEDAVAILELNASEYPDHWNVYDSLGDIYSEVNRIDDARESYKKALELNPGRESTLSKLNKLGGPAF
jgi:CubicO group peptidase (beta-lactamase class C family)